jgi:hypothetical protein
MEARAMENAMVGRKTLGRVVFFGLGYLAGTRAGRERYAQIEAGLKAVIEMLRARYAENATSTSSCPSGDGYSDIRLGD